MSALSKTCREDAGTVLQYYRQRRRDSAALQPFLFLHGWCLAFYFVLVLYINFNSNIDRHVFILVSELARLQIVLKSMWCWTVVVSAATTHQRHSGLDCGNCSLDDGLT